MEQMVADPELDARVAKEIMGDSPSAFEWAVVDEANTVIFSHPEERWARIYKDETDFDLEWRVVKRPRPFSIDIKAAMEVWEKLRQSGYWCCLTIDSDYDACWVVTLTKACSAKGDKHEPAIRENCDGLLTSLARTICLAALQAKTIMKEASINTHQTPIANKSIGTIHHRTIDIVLQKYSRTYQ